MTRLPSCLAIQPQWSPLGYRLIAVAMANLQGFRLKEWRR